MLFISTACNRMDRNIQGYAEVPARSVAQSETQTDSQRLHALEARVQQLEAELKTVNSGVADSSDASRSMNWD
jgi:hypothetical protein